MARLEHANITVGDAAKTATWLARVFGWSIRWEGSALNGNGHSIHVGSEIDYLALYEPRETKDGVKSDYATCGQLNHVGIVVDDLKNVEAAVRAEGYQPHSHQDYEPGERFYFSDENEIEYEIVAYD
jgi:catechol 2,3-dioxygenase-like lactoylglutathione lyase family enzyme